MSRAPNLFGLMLTVALCACSGTSAGGSGSIGTSGGATGTSNGGSTGGGSSSGGILGDTTAGSGSLGLGSLCEISTLTTPGSSGDPCQAAGLACNLDLEGYDHCTLPTIGEGCATSVGCAQAGICMDRGNGPRCYQGCLQTSDCAQPSSACSGCPLDDGGMATACGLSDGGQVCAPNVCGTLYVACNATASNDGICLPVLSSAGTEGLCFGTGTAALDASCSATRGGAGALCAAGGQCLTLASGASFCAPVCVSGLKDAGPGSIATSCSASELCLSLGGDLEFGACLTDCTTGNPCPGSLQCVPNATTGSNGAAVSLCL